MSRPTGLPAVPGSPAEWFETNVRRRSDQFGAYEPDSPRWVTGAELIGDGERSLTALHQQLLDRRAVPPATGATYLAGWFPGLAAEIVGLALATARAGLLVDFDTMRWHTHPDGWPQRMEIGDVLVVVTADHPWSGHAGVEVVESIETVQRRTVDALVGAVEPLIQVCRHLANVGTNGLWNEVGDGLVMVLTHFDDLVLGDDSLGIVTAASRLPGLPWRAHADLRIVDTPCGAVCVGQKGGCCLAYKVPVATITGNDDHHDEELDDDSRAFRARFPLVPDQLHYCQTCSLRDRDDAEARQIFWFERRRIAAGRLTT